jgi:NADH:ubiquinone oxidoreductase subunit 2 (subunit N)
LLLVWTLVAGSAIETFYYLRIVLTPTLSMSEQRFECVVHAREGRPILVILSLVMVLFGLYSMPPIDAFQSVLRLVVG